MAAAATKRSFSFSPPDAAAAATRRRGRALRLSHRARRPREGSLRRLHNARGRRLREGGLRLTHFARGHEGVLCVESTAHGGSGHEQEFSAEFHHARVHAEAIRRALTPAPPCQRPSEGPVCLIPAACRGGIISSSNSSWQVAVLCVVFGLWLCSSELNYRV